MKLTTLKMGLFTVLLLATIINKNLTMEKGQADIVNKMQKSNSCYNVCSLRDSHKILMPKTPKKNDTQPRPKQRKRSKSYPDLGNKTRRELEKEIENLQKIRVHYEEQASKSKDVIGTLRMEVNQNRLLFLSLAESIKRLSNENNRLKAGIELLTDRVRNVECATDSISHRILKHYLSEVNNPSPEISRKYSSEGIFVDEFYEGTLNKDNSYGQADKDSTAISLELDQELMKILGKGRSATPDYDIKKSDTVVVTELKQENKDT